jgi:hypothetical protein
MTISRNKLAIEVKKYLRYGSIIFFDVREDVHFFFFKARIFVYD